MSLACAPKKSKDPLYEIPIGDPINVFNPVSGESDAGSVTSTSLSDSLECETPTTEQRLQGQLLGANYRFVSRSIMYTGIPRSVRDEEIGYHTDGVSGKFTKSYRLNQASYRGESALGGLPLAYVDQCTASGCDENSRKYTSGNPLYKFDVESRMSVFARRDSYLPQTTCSLRSDYSPRRQTVQTGVMQLDGVSYRAVKFISRQSGTITCDVGRIQIPRTEGKSTFLGSGETVEIEIVLADKLPVSSVAALPLSNSNRGCERTKVYSSSSLVQGSKVISGTAIDIANAKVTGKILTVAEFRAAKQARADMLKRLNDNVMIARSEKNDAELGAASAKAQYTEARVKESNALAEATRLEAIGYRTGSTAAEREAALNARNAANDATAMVKRTEELVTAKNELVVVANRRLAEAEAALRKFEAENR